MADRINIQLEVTTHQQLLNLASKRGTTVDEVIQQMLQQTMLDVQLTDDEYPLLKLAGIIDTDDETDIAQDSSEVVRKGIMRKHRANYENRPD